MFVFLTMTFVVETLRMMLGLPPLGASPIIGLLISFYDFNLFFQHFCITVLTRSTQMLHAFLQVQHVVRIVHPSDLVSALFNTLPKLV